MWPQTYSLFGLGLFSSALLTATPLFTLLFLLGVLRKPAWLAGLFGLAVALLLACGGYHMPVAIAVSAAGEGAAFGIFPITWIVFSALALFRVTSDTGKFAIIKDSVGRLTPDPRLQAMLIAFAFGAFLEGAAGFGAPVAIAATMLTGLGFSAFSASAVCLLANTAPVAFGSIGIPIVTLALTTGLPADKLAAAAGQLCAPVAFLIPGYVVIALWGFKGMAGAWVPALLTGATFAGVQLGVSNLMGAPLTDILASLASMAVLVGYSRIQRRERQTAFVSTRHRDIDEIVKDETLEKDAPSHSTATVLYAWLPYGLLVLCVLLWGWKPVHTALDSLSFSFPWPWLHDMVRRMPPIVVQPAAYHAIYNVNWFAASGTACMVAAVLSAICYRMPPMQFVRVLFSVAKQLLLPTLTVTSVLAVAFVMSYCGATATLGLAFAATGKIFPFFSALLGWLAVFLTGSDTAANALFGNLQTITATKLGLSPVLMAATNSVGGTMGKMISLQTIAVAAAATGISTANQARLLQFTLKHSVLLVCVVGCVAMLLAYLPR